MQRTCQQCGAGFQAKPARVRSGGGKFCSMTCYAAHQREHPHGGTGQPARPSIERICAGCGEPFTTSAARPRRHCSHACSYTGRRITKVCATCGTEFSVTRSNAARYTRCSRTCGVEYRECARCGIRFDSKGGRLEHCSEECRRPPVTSNCLNCEATFRHVPSEDRRFCSVTCYRAYDGETAPEANVRLSLDTLGIRYAQEADVIGARWPVDFHLLDHGLVIEVDSTYWHSQPGVPERDADKDDRVRAVGLHVIRLDSALFAGDHSAVMVETVADAVREHEVAVT